MASVNKIIIIGNLGSDAEVNFLPSGDTALNFRVATSERYRDKEGNVKEDTEWHRVVVYGKLADAIAQYLTKGRSVYVEGRLRTRKWQDKEGRDQYTTEVLAREVKLLGGNGRGQQDGQGGAQPQGSAPAQTGPRNGLRDEPPVGGFHDDDIPF